MQSLPILRDVSPLGRIVLGGTVAVSLLSIVLEWGVGVHGAPIFIVSAAGILGLAYVVGISTERLGAFAGPHVGGILNATFGNIAELIIAFFALQAGQLEVVKASLTGSIIGNLLLVLGASLFLGGLKNGLQRFNAKVAGLDSTLLVLAVIGLVIPATFAASLGAEAGIPRQAESILVAVVLLILYFGNLFYRFRHPAEVLGNELEGHGGPSWTARQALGVLGIAAVFLAVLSEQLVGAIDPFIEAFDLTPFFVGVILIPTIGNLAEHLVGVQLALKNKVEFSMAVSIGSSLQVALFVAPVLVLLGIVVGKPMDLVFTSLEVAAVAVAALITALISLDGESNWLEGALLLGVYTILGVSFFFLP
ncbi:MAG: Ca2+:H+ antiporter [Chloroflexota bacterium]|jgi:Ca2+:H+ antiporter|nr:Ca2+:H+ antiporter [Chloroflexota bacterium]